MSVPNDREAKLLQAATAAARALLPHATDLQIENVARTMIVAGTSLDLIEGHPSIEVAVALKRLQGQVVKDPGATEMVRLMSEMHEVRHGEAMDAGTRMSLFRKYSAATPDERIEAAKQAGITLQPLTLQTAEIVVPASERSDHQSAVPTVEAKAATYYEDEIFRTFGKRRHELLTSDFVRFKRSIEDRDRQNSKSDLSENERLIAAGVKRLEDFSPVERITLERRRLARERTD